jgi:hypothetical protein
MMMKKAIHASLWTCSALLCGIVSMLVITESADACDPYCGPCGYWSSSEQKCVPYPGSLCLEAADCGTCGDCVDPPTCHCVADEDACTGECDECDTSGDDTFNCYDVQAQCNQVSSQVCETCVDGLCQDDDEKCLVCGDCVGGHCWSNDEKCSGCERCYVQNCYDYDPYCPEDEVCQDTNCVDAGFCQVFDTCVPMYYCSVYDGTSEAECENSGSEGPVPVGGTLDYQCSSGAKCETWDEEIYCVLYESCAWDPVFAQCNRLDYSGYETTANQQCRDKNGEYSYEVQPSE